MIHLFVVTVLYFLPTIVRAHRGHPVTGILPLNIFFGWTGIGWVAMLLWALLSRPMYYAVPAQYGPHDAWRR